MARRPAPDGSIGSQSSPVTKVTFIERLKRSAKPSNCVTVTGAGEVQDISHCLCCLCSPRLYHNAHVKPQNHIDNWGRVNPILKLQIASHCPLDLALAAINSFRDTSDNDHQLDWMYYETGHGSGIVDRLACLKDPRASKAKKMERLKFAFDFFNLVYFGNSLTDVELQWLDGRTKLGKRAHGKTRHNKATGKTIIYIEHTSRKLLKQGEKGLLGTLLHEMIHAYLKKYRCRHQRCLDPRVCRQLARSNTGILGHGRAFQWLATAIEEDVCGNLDVPISIGMARSVKVETEAGGAHPSLHDLKMCFRGSSCLQ